MLQFQWTVSWLYLKWNLACQRLSSIGSYLLRQSQWKHCHYHDDYMIRLGSKLEAMMTWLWTFGHHHLFNQLCKSKVFLSLPIRVQQRPFSLSALTIKMKIILLIGLVFKGQYTLIENSLWLFFFFFLFFPAKLKEKTQEDVLKNDGQMKVKRNQNCLVTSHILVWNFGSHSFSYYILNLTLFMEYFWE